MPSLFFCAFFLVHRLQNVCYALRVRVIFFFESRFGRIQKFQPKIPTENSNRKFQPIDKQEKV